jgi:hypothetical protein
MSCLVLCCLLSSSPIAPSVVLCCHVFCVVLACIVLCCPAFVPVVLPHLVLFCLALPFFVFLLDFGDFHSCWRSCCCSVALFLFMSFLCDMDKNKTNNKNKTQGKTENSKAPSHLAKLYHVFSCPVLSCIMFFLSCVLLCCVVWCCLVVSCLAMCRFVLSFRKTLTLGQI